MGDRTRVCFLFSQEDLNREDLRQVLSTYGRFDPNRMAEDTKEGSGLWLEMEEMNYAGDTLRAQLRKLNVSYLGYSDCGGSYGPEDFYFKAVSSGEDTSRAEKVWQCGHDGGGYVVSLNPDGEISNETREDLKAFHLGYMALRKKLTASPLEQIAICGAEAVEESKNE